MQITEEARHWERVYAEKDPHEVSWYEPVLEHSLALIAEAQLDRNAAILDVGGGASTLASDLLRGGYTDITVADISATSMARARSNAGRPPSGSRGLRPTFEATTSAVATTSGMTGRSFTSWSRHRIDSSTSRPSGRRFIREVTS
jgi:hypothetical protein